MVRSDPYTPTRGYYECPKCGARKGGDTATTACPECGATMQNLAVPRE